jgi:hypothetical protein
MRRLGGLNGKKNSTTEDTESTEFFEEFTSSLLGSVSHMIVHFCTLLIISGLSVSSVVKALITELLSEYRAY